MSKNTVYNPNSPGAPEAVEQPIEYGFNQSGGYFTRRSWRGTKAGLDAIASTLTAAGWSWSIKGGPVFTLEATLGADDVGGGTETPTINFEILPNRIEKDFLESNVTAAAPLFTQTEIEEIREAINQNDRGLAPTSANGWEAYLLILQGLKAAVVHQVTVNKTMIVSRNYPLSSTALENVGKIYSKATLISEENIPTIYRDGLPNDTSPADSYTGDLVNYPRLRYGYYKNYPTIHQVSFDKFQVSQTWEYGLWAKLIYGEPI